MRNKRETAVFCLMCDSPRKKRGLCQMHYERFRRAKADLPINLRERFDDELVQTGKLLPRNVGGKLDDEEFTKLAADFILKESKTTQQDLSTVAETAEKFKRKKKEPDK